MQKIRYGQYKKSILFLLVTTKFKNVFYKQHQKGSNTQEDFQEGKLQNIIEIIIEDLSK